MNVVLGKAGLANSNSTDLWKEGLQLSKRTRMRFHKGPWPLQSGRPRTMDRSIQHMSLSKDVESR